MNYHEEMIEKGFKVMYKVPTTLLDEAAEFYKGSSSFDTYYDSFHPDASTDEIFNPLINRALVITLKRIGVVIKPRAIEGRTTVKPEYLYSYNYCYEAILSILNRIAYGDLHLDAIGMTYILNIRNYNDVDIWFKDVQLFNKVL